MTAPNSSAADEESGVEAAQPAPRTAGARRGWRFARAGLGWLFAAIGAVLFAGAFWIRRTFGEISIDQMLMHLPGAGAEETTTAETGYISSFVWQVFVVPLGALLLLAILVIVTRRALTPNLDRARAAAPSKPGLLRRAAPTLLAVGALVTGVAVFAQTVGLPQYLRSVISPYSMDDYYAAPLQSGAVSTAAATGDASPQNLVVIYLESIEEAFAERETFGANLLAPVEAATSDWDSISDLSVYEGGGWTMAGIVGTQCGVPLRGPGIGANDLNSNEIGSDSAAYLPAADCLGDVLRAEGYTSAFLGGADAGFASKADFLRGHGYDEVKDLDYWVETGETEFSVWGLSDRALMENAKAEVARLHESGQPFNLTMLTLDSHEPAHLFDYCEATLEDELSDVIRCSMEQVAGFIDYMDAAGYLDDTVVVLMGDHPKMVAEGGSFWNELAPRQERPLFNRVWSPGAELSFVEETDQLSMFATMLDLLGFGAEDQRAGVGVSALAQSPWRALDLTPERYAELIASRSASLYERLWGVDSADSVEAIG